MSRGRKPRAERPEPSREQLMAAAIDCFARLGYQGTTIDRIARDAGVTKGAVYYHFRDKEELLFEAVKDRGGGRHHGGHHRSRGSALPGPGGGRSPAGPRHAGRAGERVARHRKLGHGRRSLGRQPGMVNFKPTDEQELIRQTIAGFAREVLRPAAREADEKNGVPETVVQRGWELGLVQSPIPEALGGYGAARSAVTSALILEELAYGDLALALHLLVPRLLTIPLLVAGTEEQRRRWLPRFAGAAFTVGTAAFVA